MKQLIYIITFTAALFLLGSCEDKPNGGPSAGFDLEKIHGEWELTTWEGEAPSFEVYIDFKEDETFDLYQKTESVRFVKYSGVYTIDDHTLSGIYDDGVTWGSDYAISFEDNQLILNSMGEVAEENVYSRTTIPDEVINEAHNNVQSRCIGEFVRIL